MKEEWNTVLKDARSFPPKEGYKIHEYITPNTTLRAKAPVVLGKGNVPLSVSDLYDMIVAGR